MKATEKTSKFHQGVVWWCSLSTKFSSCWMRLNRLEIQAQSECDKGDGDEWHFCAFAHWTIALINSFIGWLRRCGNWFEHNSSESINFMRMKCCRDTCDYGDSIIASSPISTARRDKIYDQLCPKSMSHSGTAQAHVNFQCRGDCMTNTMCFLPTRCTRSKSFRAWKAKSGNFNNSANFIQYWKLYFMLRHATMDLMDFPGTLI